MEKTMYTSNFKYLKNNHFHPLPFGFRQKYSTGRPLISLKKNIKKYLNRNFESLLVAFL